MRRMLVMALCLLLAGCGAPAEPEPERTPEPQQTQVAAETAAGVTMELERTVYDPTLTTYTYFLHNGTGETLWPIGEAFSIQRRAGDDWEDLTLRDGTGWNDIGYTLEPGETLALACGFWPYEEPAEAGEYRLVKEVCGRTLTAEFSLGESVYTARTPYGFTPLEELPESYGAGDAVGSGAACFTDHGTENGEAVEAFLKKAALGVPCQLRTVQDHAQGIPMVIDVIYEDGRFLWKMRSGEAVSHRYCSYLVTDGTDLYLSDGADWDAGERYGDRRIFLVPPLQGTAWVSAVEAMTVSRLAGSAVRYQVWSGDGCRSAGLTETSTAFFVSWREPDRGSGGASYDLADWDGLETAVTGLSWQADGTLLLTCETSMGGISRLCFDPETEELSALELPSLPEGGSSAEKDSI